MEWLAVIVGTIAAVAVAFLKGSQSGKNEVENDALEKLAENIAKAKQAANDVASDDIDTVRQRLRDNARK